MGLWNVYSHTEVRPIHKPSAPMASHAKGVLQHQSWGKCCFQDRRTLLATGSSWWHLPDGVVRGAADHEAVPVLQAGDAALVPVQRPHKLARAGAPHLGTRDKLPESCTKQDSCTAPQTTSNSQTEADRGLKTHRASSEVKSRARAPVGIQQGQSHRYCYGTEKSWGLYLKYFQVAETAPNDFKTLITLPKLKIILKTGASKHKTLTLFYQRNYYKVISKRNGL